MKIKWKVSRLANEFFFVSTLAGWHYSCRKDVRETWLHKTGKLMPEEKRALATFSRLMRAHYGFQSEETYLGEIFYKCTEREVWPAIKKIVKNPEDYVLLKNIFSTLHVRFTRAWKDVNLTSLKVLENELRKKSVNDFFRDTTLLFGGKRAQNSSVTVIVLSTPLGGDKTAAGSANLKGDFITLETPAFKKNTWQLSYSLALLGHELGHRYFAGHGGETMIRDAMRELHLKNQYATLPFSTKTILNEAVTAAFLPLGTLGQKYFSDDLMQLFLSNMQRVIDIERLRNSKRTISYYGHLDIWFVWKLFPLSLEYIYKKKTIDKNFIRETAFLLKKIIGSQ